MFSSNKDIRNFKYGKILKPILKSRVLFEEQMQT